MTTTETRVSQLDRLVLALTDLGQLLPTLVVLLPEPDTGGARTGTIGRHVPDGSEPWNTAVADVLWGAYFGLGTLVNDLRIHLGMAELFPPPRGACAIPVLADLAAGCPDHVLKAPAGRVEAWATRAAALPGIDQGEPWVGVPGVGGRPPACPYCHTLGLRMRKLAGEIKCVMPGCVDADGRPTRARMERGRMTGEACLVFGDGLMMSFEGDGNAGRVDPP